MGDFPPLRHQPAYCEENAWHLLDDPRLGGRAAEVWLVSNPERRVVMWGQRAAEHPKLPIAWDYHVVVLARSADEDALELWDLDHARGCPRSAGEWLLDSFAPLSDYPFPPSAAPRFRVFSAERYRREFSSDRRHMRNPEADGWLAPVPPWPPIQGAPGSPWTLGAWLDFTPRPELPPWRSLAQMHTRFGLAPPKAHASGFEGPTGP